MVDSSIGSDIASAEPLRETAVAGRACLPSPLSLISPQPIPLWLGLESGGALGGEGSRNQSPRQFRGVTPLSFPSGMRDQKFSAVYRIKNFLDVAMVHEGFTRGM